VYKSISITPNKRHRKIGLAATIHSSSIIFFPLISLQTFTVNLFKNPLVSITGRIQLMNVEANTQMNEITIQPVKKPREKT
jgi:hypothetical protein